MIYIYFLKTYPLASKSKQKKLCSLQARELVLKAYSELTGNSAGVVKFAEHASGKPYIKGSDRFHFNISHSENAVAVAVGNSPLGIDIEALKPAKTDVAERFFTEAENAYISACPAETDRRFFEIWTKKEAAVKQSGKGLSQGLKSFDVTDKGFRRWLGTFEKDGFILSICAEKAEEFCIIEAENPKINNMQT